MGNVMKEQETVIFGECLNYVAVIGYIATDLREGVLQNKKIDNKKKYVSIILKVRSEEEVTLLPMIAFGELADKMKINCCKGQLVVATGSATNYIDDKDSIQSILHIKSLQILTPMGKETLEAKAIKELLSGTVGGGDEEYIE
jgi:hypothetical protein